MSFNIPDINMVGNAVAPMQEEDVEMLDATQPISLQAPVSKQYSEINIILNDIYNTDARRFIFGHIAQIRDFWYKLKTTLSLPLHTNCGDLR